MRKRPRERRGAISANAQEAEAFAEQTRIHASLAQAEQFLETKLHGLVGVGGESTAILYRLIQKLAHIRDQKILQSKV